MSHHFKKNPDVSWQVVEGQAVLIHNRLGEIHVLNEVGSIVWENLEKGVDEIVRIILKDYDVEEDVARNDVENFINELKEAQAIIE